MVSKAFKLAAIAKSTNINGIVAEDAAPSLLTTYATIDLLPLSGNQPGNMAYIDSDNKLLLYTGEGWYSMSLTNQAPTITSAYVNQYTLAKDGTPTVITLTASDPEDLPLTWSYAVTSGTLGSTATISQANNVFTITPSTDENDAGEFTITFTASDGFNTDTIESEFILTFVVPTGQQEYTSPGTYSWTAPVGVDTVCVVCVGGGGGGMSRNGNGGFGGGGGGLGWKNNIPVTPGQSYTVVVGSGGLRLNSSDTSLSAENGGDSYFISLDTVSGLGGAGGKYGTSAGEAGFTGDGGGYGGDVVGHTGTADATGGGGAGGYSGNGGSSSINVVGTSGSGGGGGGGGAGGAGDAGGAGGGVGIYGQGADGSGGTYGGANGGPGGGGSGGEAGSASPGSTARPSTGGLYGGGGGGAELVDENGEGAGGAVRIIWGENRAFPSTNTADILP